MEHYIHPLLLYGAIVLGCVGVCLALPRRGLSPQVVGALLAGVAAGLVVLGLGLRASRGGEGLPSPFFYVFGVISLGAGLRVVTHPKPVYAALWFIMTVLSTAGLFLLLSAEFMAAALIIVYAGAILITYLFVIMLASNTPADADAEQMATYDSMAREPVAASVVGFVLLGVLTTMIFRGLPQVPASGSGESWRLLGDMPRKAQRVLEGAGLLQSGERVAAVDVGQRVVRVEGPAGERTIAGDAWPVELSVGNVEGVGFNLLRDHPGTIEIAGVILLMAMLGAVVLSRKQVQLDEEAKQGQARTLAGTMEGAR